MAVQDKAPSIFSHLLLTPGEKDAFAKWSPTGSARSCASRFAEGLPDRLAPTLLSVASVLVALKAWCFVEAHYQSGVVRKHALMPGGLSALADEAHAEFWPAVSSVVIAFAACASGFLLQLGDAHGRHAKIGTPLAELFRHVCGSVVMAFLAACSGPIMLSGKLSVQWCLVQFAQLVLVAGNYRALLGKPGNSDAYLGLLLGVTTFGFLVHLASGSPPHAILSVHAATALVILGEGFVLCPGCGSKGKPTHRMLCLITALHGLGVIVRLGLDLHWHPTHLEVIGDGLLLGLVSSDLVLARMSDRELHPAAAVASCGLLLPSLPGFSFGLAALYYAAVFGDLMSYLDMPLFGVCRNVYCDGIYDLCHIGHKNLFRNAAKLGDRLFVGVVNDKDTEKYKRTPMMTAAEREAEVAACKGVTAVIPNAPCFGLTEEFLREHRIHVVAFGQEYKDRFPDPKDDPYYRVPREMGIAVPMPRTECFSTSDLLDRVKKKTSA